MNSNSKNNDSESDEAAATADAAGSIKEATHSTLHDGTADRRRCNNDNDCQENAAHIVDLCDKTDDGRQREAIDKGLSSVDAGEVPKEEARIHRNDDVTIATARHVNLATLHARR
eukprot:scaffold545059_cov29-Prasinocladus_malaysianus.AAC.1